MPIITRHGYCPQCEHSRNPRTGQRFLAYGSTHHKYFIEEVQHNGSIGFVPHIYKGKVVGNNVIVEISCAMEDCGAEVDKGFMYIKEFRREVWTLEQWNALVLYKRDSDYQV